MLYKIFTESKELHESAQGVYPSDEQLEELSDEFAQALDVPKEPMDPQSIIAMVGLVGSGKTTISRGLCARLALIHLRTDDMRAFLTQRGFSRTRTIEMALHLLGTFIQSGQSAILDADCVRFHSELEDYAKARGLRLIWLHVATPEEEILHRLREENDAREYKGEKAIEKYHERKALHVELPMTFLYTFNVDDKSLEQQLDEVTKRITIFKVEPWVCEG